MNGILGYEYSAYAMSYGGLLYDLFVGLLLIWNPTFWIGITATIFFHTLNKLVFNIGIFPYLMIASTSLFFRPDWPSRITHKLLKHNGYVSGEYIPVADTTVKLSGYIPTKNRKKLTFKQKLAMLLVVIFMAYWILMPIRFLAMPSDKGPQAWTENGHMVHFKI